jgi:lysozyme family protein
MTAFGACVNFVLAPSIEGGLSDHPNDPGGRTNRGVTQRRLDSVRIDHPEIGLPRIVDELTREQCVAIYRVCEWAWIKGDQLPGPIALLMFDCAVNQGQGRAIDCLQASLNVKRDGVLGPITLAAARSANIKTLAAEFCARRGYEYAILDQLDDTFALGWMRRLIACYTLAISGDTAP